MFKSLLLFVSLNLALCDDDDDGPVSFDGNVESSDGSGKDAYHVTFVKVEYDGTTKPICGGTVVDPRYRHRHNSWPNGCTFRKKKEQPFGHPLCKEWYLVHIDIVHKIIHHYIPVTCSRAPPATTPTRPGSTASG